MTEPLHEQYRIESINGWTDIEIRQDLSLALADMTDMNSRDEVCAMWRTVTAMTLTYPWWPDLTGRASSCQRPAWCAWTLCLVPLRSASGDQAASCCPAAFAHPIKALASQARSRLGSLHLPFWFICSSKHRQLCAHHLLCTDALLLPCASAVLFWWANQLHNKSTLSSNKRKDCHRSS